jgi:hypothetical protein
MQNLTDEMRNTTNELFMMLLILEFGGLTMLSVESRSAEANI